MSKIINLKTKTSRKNLTPRAEPYWLKLPAALVKGAALGFKRSPDTGAETWHARVYVDGVYRKTTLDPVTDHFQYAEAYNAAINWSKHQKVATPAAAREYTMEEVIDEYLVHLQGNSSRRLMDKRRQAAKRLNALMTPALNNKKVSQLAKSDLTALRRQYSKRTNLQGQLISADSVNRVMSHLIAALNHAYKEGMVKDKTAWKTYTRLEESETKRRAKQNVPMADQQAFLEASEGAFKAIVTALSITAARPSELRRLRVSDVDLTNDDPDEQGVYLTHYKGNKSKGSSRLFALPAGSAVRELFAQQVEGKKPTDPVFLTEKGKPWSQANLAKAHNKVRDDNDLHAGLETYIWRHLRISQWCRSNDVAPSEVARAAGTSLAYIEKNYYKSDAATRAKLAVM